MITNICLIIIVILAVVATSFWRWGQYWKRRVLDNANFYAQAKDERREIADALRRKCLEFAEQQKEIKDLEEEIMDLKKESKKLRRNK